MTGLPRPAPCAVRSRHLPGCVCPEGGPCVPRCPVCVPASPGGPRGPVHVVGAQQDVDWYNVSRMGNSAEVQQRIYQRLLREIGVLAGLRCGRVSQVEDLPPERVRVHADLWVVADREEYLRIMAQAESDRAKVLALEELLRTGAQRVYR